MSAHRILICSDCPNWAYHRRSAALQKYAPEDFEVTVCFHSSPPSQDQLFSNQDLRSFDLVANI